MVNFKIRIGVFLFSVMLALMSCSKVVPIAPDFDNMYDVAPAYLDQSSFDNMTDSYNRSGIALTKWLIGNEKNVFSSPFSIAEALSVLSVGACANTLDEIVNVIGLSAYPEDQRLAWFYKNRKNRVGKGVEYISANSLWVDHYPLKQEFVNTVSYWYDVDSFSVPFSKPSSADAINKWCSDHTRGMIPVLLDFLDPAISAIFVNTQYFSAPWKLECQDYDGELMFSGRACRAFSCKAGSIYVNNDAFVLASLPLGELGEYSVDFILPHRGIDVSYVMDFLMENSYRDIITSAGREHVSFILPVVDVEFGVSLRDIMTTMGLKTIFDSNTANLARMSDMRGMHIDNILHKSHLTMDKTGVEAASATVSILDGNSGIIPEYKDFVVNRPYVCIIRNTKTDVILFIAVIQNPFLE